MTAEALRLLRLPEVKALTTLGKSAIYERVKNGSFPQPCHLGRTSAWAESEVLAWIAARLAERGQS
jgi:prophage regulatory protein